MAKKTSFGVWLDELEGAARKILKANGLKLPKRGGVIFPDQLVGASAQTNSFATILNHVACLRPIVDQGNQQLCDAIEEGILLGQELQGLRLRPMLQSALNHALLF